MGNARDPRFPPMTTKDQPVAAATGPLDSEKEAKTELAKTVARMATAGYREDRKIKLGPYLDRWHANRVSVPRRMRERPGQMAEARGFEPRMGANPNRISSAAP